MKKFSLVVLLFSTLVLVHRTEKKARKLQTIQAPTGGHSDKHASRKLVFSPYVNVNQDLTARDLGDETKDDPPKHENAMMGPFSDAPVPAYGLGGMVPPSLGLTHQPYNYMYGSPMMHPMNPAHSMGGMDSMGGMGGMGSTNGMSAMGGMGQGAGDAGAPAPDHHVDGQHPQAHEMHDFNEMGDDVKFNDDYDVTRKLKLFEDPLDPNDGLVSQCKDTQKQAIQISNAIMKKQNRVIYKEVMKYLLKSKYLVAMTEIKLVRVLRKKIYGLMKEYSSITEDKLDVIPMDKQGRLDHYLSAEELHDKYGDHNNEFGLGDDTFDEDLDEEERRKRRHK